VLVFRRSRPDAPRFDVSLELGSGDSLTSPLLPGFSLPVDEIFAA
jgi:Uma2 family endonuclease